MIDNHISNKQIFPLGIGGWGLGGFAEKDPKNNDKEQIDALIYMMSRGMNLVEANLWNSEGKSVEIIKKAYFESGIKRNKYIINQAIYNYRNPKFQDAKNELDKMLKIFETDYIDSLEFNALCYLEYEKSKIFDFYHEALY